MTDHNKNLVLSQVAIGDVKLIISKIKEDQNRRNSTLNFWYDPKENRYYYTDDYKIHHSNYAWLVNDSVPEYYDDIINGDIIRTMVNMGYVRVRVEPGELCLNVEGLFKSCKKMLKEIYNAGLLLNKIYFSIKEYEDFLVYGEDVIKFCTRGLVPIGTRRIMEDVSQDVRSKIREIVLDANYWSNVTVDEARVWYHVRTGKLFYMDVEYGVHHSQFAHLIEDVKKTDRIKDYEVLDVMYEKGWVRMLSDRKKKEFGLNGLKSDIKKTVSLCIKNDFNRILIDVEDIALNDQGDMAHFFTKDNMETLGVFLRTGKIPSKRRRPFMSLVGDAR